MSDKFYGADGTKGTVAATNGSKTVTGTGTGWLTNGAVPTIGGYSIKMPDGEIYGIDACASDTGLTLVDNYHGTNVSGGAYYIIPLEAAVVKLVEMVATLLNSGSYSQLAGLAGMSAGDLIQYVGGAWAKRTPTQALLSLFSSLGEEEVASSGTANIGSAASMRVFISGTTTITSLGTTPNALRIVRFGGALTLTHNATSLILPTGANITTASGDTGIFVSDGSGNWRCYAYHRANGRMVNMDAPSFTGSVTVADRLGVGLSPSATHVLAVTNAGASNGNWGQIGACFLGGRSHGDYPIFGYNFRGNGTTWLYHAADSASFTHYNAGTIDNYVAAAGSAGATMSPTLATRIDSAGRFVVGATSAQASAQISALQSNNACIGYFVLNRPGAAFTTDAVSIDVATSTAGTSWNFFSGYDRAASAYRVIIAGNGNIVNANNSYGSISDRKVKRDIVLAGSQWADIKALAAMVSKYRLIDAPDGPLQIGLIAQDVQTVSPGLVFSKPDVERIERQKLESGEPVIGDDGQPVMEIVFSPSGTETLGINYSVLYMKAVKALGEALERIESLEQRLADAGL